MIVKNRKSLEIKKIIRQFIKTKLGEIVDRKTWLEISEDQSYIIRDISNREKKVESRHWSLLMNV